MGVATAVAVDVKESTAYAVSVAVGVATAAAVDVRPPPAISVSVAVGVATAAAVDVSDQVKGPGSGTVITTARGGLWLRATRTTVRPPPSPAGPICCGEEGLGEGAGRVPPGMGRPGAGRVPPGMGRPAGAFAGEASGTLPAPSLTTAGSAGTGCAPVSRVSASR